MTKHENNDYVGALDTAVDDVRMLPTPADAAQELSKEPVDRGDIIASDGRTAAVVLLAVAVGGTLFGIVGAFLAVPVAAVAAVWLRYWAEMVSLRSGEITADEIAMATQQTQTMDSKSSFLAVRDHMMRMATREKSNTKVPVKEGLGSTRVPLGEAEGEPDVPGRTHAIKDEE